MLEIVRYGREHENALMDMIRREGEDWKVYWGQPNAEKYRAALARSITYVALSDGAVCGYSRSLEDALYLYVCDLLVDKAYRGLGLGKKLMTRLWADYPGLPVYVMSGSDGYYEKIGCKKEGSIYLLN